MISIADPFICLPRISRNTFSDVLRQSAASVVVDERDPGEYWDAITAFAIDPLFVLAMFQHESKMGKEGVAIQTHSWGNTRMPSFGATPVGEVPGASGSFAKFANWLDGCKSTAARLADSSWVYFNRTSVSEVFIHPSGLVWAPAGDFNDPQGYLRSVIDFMNAHTDQPSGRIGKPDILTDIRAQAGHFDGYGPQDGMPRRVEAIVFHISDGAEGNPPDGSAGDLFQLTQVVSSNYYINKAGVIRELVPPDHSSWANGPRQDPNRNNPLIRGWDDAGINPNTRTISIEHEGKPGNPLTDAQVASNIALTAWLARRFEVPIDRTHILGHYEIDNVDRWYCPSFSDRLWQTLLDGARAAGQSQRRMSRMLDPLTLPDLEPVPRNGHFVPFVFGRFYDQHGGVPVFGLFITGVFPENGKLVQYTERWRFEYNPAVDAMVQGGLVGSEALLAQHPNGPPG